MNNYFKRYMTSKGLLSRWWIVSIMFSALLATSCRTTKENTSMSLRDSLEWNRKVSVSLATIPSSLAELTIPIDSLRRLPEGAAYTKKSGNTRVTASIKDDSLHVEAETECAPGWDYTEEEGEVRIRDQLIRQETTKEPVAIPFWAKLKWCLTGVSITILFILTIILYKKYGKKIRRHY